MSAQEEIKQRLEVAQLYEDMGQTPKAARYYVAAAETALKAKLFDKGRELLEKTLQLEPENAQAKTYLQKLDQHLASLGHAPSASSTQAASSAPVGAAAGSGGVTVPTPSLTLRGDQISAILSQVTSAPNPKFFPFTALPKIDINAVTVKNQKLEAARESERAKDRTAVESAFSSSGGGFTRSESGGSFLNQNRPPRKREKEAAEEPKGDAGRRKRGANESLADSIRKKIQGS